MSVTLDGQILFDEHQLEFEFESVGRDSIEKTVGGLDGVISIDLGQRGRVIKQKGALRAKSKAEMRSRVDSISAYMDGNTHTLITKSGETYENLRLDVFRIKKEFAVGSGVACEYEIVYRQVMV
ncbi:MAG: hypothetical protein FVQ80_01340 [Planctomycetes bacterium]|nr:hypothetical protein [Planctomycetota bacterium]